MRLNACNIKPMYTKWTYYPLAADDPKAKMQVLENLQMGAHEHTLSKKLLQRFSEASGAMLLIAFETLDLDTDRPYKYAGTYCGGQLHPPNYELITWMDTARWGLVTFVDKHLCKSKEAVVLCENVFAERKDVPNYTKESRMLFFNEEVYHVVTYENAYMPDSIEQTIRESEHQWAVGVCSSCAEVPQGDVLSESFFDVIVANTTHIFTPALDGDGYLVWSPLVSVE